MEWIPLTSADGLEQIIQDSANKPVLIFKHSTRCSISSTALNRLERGWGNDSTIKTYFLDLITYRAVSNQIASTFGITHQSPQALVIKDGRCIFDASHMSISATEILKTALAS